MGETLVLLVQQLAQQSKCEAAVIYETLLGSVTYMFHTALQGVVYR